MQAIAQRQAEAYPDTNKAFELRPMELRQFVTGDLTRQYTLLLMGAVGFVLLIACANVANVQFARVTGRVGEFAIRTALGGSRWRVVRQLLIESILLSLARRGAGAVTGAVGHRHDPGAYAAGRGQVRRRMENDSAGLRRISFRVGDFCRQRRFVWHRAVPAELAHECDRHAEGRRPRLDAGARAAPLARSAGGWRSFAGAGAAGRRWVCWCGAFKDCCR